MTVAVAAAFPGPGNVHGEQVRVFQKETQALEGPGLPNAERQPRTLITHHWAALSLPAWRN